MRIVQDNLEGEFFIEVILTFKEWDLLKEHNLLSKSCLFLGEIVSFGVKVEEKEEEEN